MVELGGGWVILGLGVGEVVGGFEGWGWLRLGVGRIEFLVIKDFLIILIGLWRGF